MRRRDGASTRSAIFVARRTSRRRAFQQGGGDDHQRIKIRQDGHRFCFNRLGDIFNIRVDVSLECFASRKHLGLSAVVHVVAATFEVGFLDGDPLLPICVDGVG